MPNDQNIRQALTDYILLHDSTHSKAKLASYTILELIVIKTELELAATKAKSFIP